MKYEDYVQKITEGLVKEINSLILAQDRLGVELQAAFEDTSFMRGLTKFVWNIGNPKYVSAECNRFINHCKMLQAPPSFVENFKHKTAFEIGWSWIKKGEYNE